MTPISGQVLWTLTEPGGEPGWACWLSSEFPSLGHTGVWEVGAVCAGADGALEVLAEFGIVLVDAGDRLADRPRDAGSGAFGCRSGSSTAATEANGAVLGSNTAPLWVEVAEFLRTAMPGVEERTIDGVGHLLHIQEPQPVAQEIADFLGRHPLRG